MAQSLSKIRVHMVFSTKGRVPYLDDVIRPELYAYASTVMKNLNCPAIQIGGTEDHIHVLCTLSKNVSMAKLVEEVKKPISHWLKSKGDEYRNFQWQNGYGAFSVSQSDVKSVQEYIVNQEEHHQKLTFQEEFRRLLERHEIEFDERYLWG